jgi:hypothetical protein
MEQKKIYYNTTELNLAAFFILKDLELLALDSTDPTRCVFTFELNEALSKVMSDWFERQAEGNISQFLRIQKELKIKGKRHA